MISPDQARGLALALPGAIEHDHHGRPSFRMAGRIFATLWDPEHLNVLLDESGVRTAVQAAPGTCQEFWWGARLRAVQVDLNAADEVLVRELLADAWEQKAPRLQALARAFQLGEDDLEAWRKSGLPAKALDDWMTDRVARRPAGRRARETYGAERVHDFARRAILAALRLTGEDRLLEVGCGGGLLLRDALLTGASVTGLDHSREMVELSRERAPGAEVILGSAEALPFEAAAFTAVAMSVVFLFFAEPLIVLGEARRVLSSGGRLAVYTTSPALRGTAAAPEPLAGRSHFHESHELIELAEAAGLRNAVVEDRDGGQLLTASA